MSRRSRAREVALQSLYQHDLTGDTRPGADRLAAIHDGAFDVMGIDLESVDHADLVARATEDLLASYGQREQEVGGAAVLREVERRVMLTVIDRKWREHLYEMDALRDGIGLRAVGQRDPLTEYQREAYDSFAAMMSGVKEEAVTYVMRLQLERPQQPAGGSAAPAGQLGAAQRAVPLAQVLGRGGVRTSGPSEPGTARAAATRTAEERVGRNEPCPCGSGQKYKRCHGAA